MRQDRATHDQPPGDPRAASLTRAVVFGAPDAVLMDLPQLTEDHVEQPWRRPRTPGDLIIRWTRRFRALSADNWRAVEAPLGEETEAYEVEILGGVTEKRVLSGLARIWWRDTASVLRAAASKATGDT